MLLFEQPDRLVAGTIKFIWNLQFRSQNKQKKGDNLQAKRNKLQIANH